MTCNKERNYQRGSSGSWRTYAPPREPVTVQRAAPPKAEQQEYCKGAERDQQAHQRLRLAVRRGELITNGGASKEAKQDAEEAPEPPCFVTGRNGENPGTERYERAKALSPISQPTSTCTPLCGAVN